MHVWFQFNNVFVSFVALAVVSRITSMIEEEAEDKFEPSSIAAEGSIATSSPQAAIFVTKEQAAELYAGKYKTNVVFSVQQ